MSRATTANGTESTSRISEEKDETRIAERKAEAYDLIRLIEQAKARLAELNPAIARMEQEK